MDLKERLKIFKDELALIANRSIKDFIKACIEEAPDYIFEDCPSSTTGKYHPIDEVAADGTIIHTKRVFALAYDLARGLDVEDKRDTILAAAILHDFMKQGPIKRGHTDHDHPRLMAETITKVYEEKGFRDKLPVEVVQELYWVVAYHYGPWTNKTYKKDMKDYSLVELALYIADYISSKRFVSIDYKRRTD